MRVSILSLHMHQFFEEGSIAQYIIDATIKELKAPQKEK
jgi:hypothetical protein